MRKSYLFTAICLFAAALMTVGSTDVYAGTTGKIQGVVRDAQTGETLPGANVVLEGTKRGATTDVNGFYIILLVDPGSYAMSASLIGYDAQRKTDVRVQSDFKSEAWCHQRKTTGRVQERRWWDSIRKRSEVSRDSTRGGAGFGRLQRR